MRRLFQALVTKHEPIAKNISLLELSGVSQELPPFSAGSHIDIQIPGLSDAWRSYSLCNDPEERNRYEIAILCTQQTTRSGSHILCHEIHVGSILTLSEPHNTFPLDESATEYLLIAGGIGITPLRSMMFTLRKKKKPFALIYTTRTPEEMAFRADLSTGSEQILLHWSRDFSPGRMNFSSAMGAWHQGRKIYCCAPEGLMKDVRTTALALQWPGEAICFERFSTPFPSSAPETQPCEVIAALSKKKTFSQAGETLLQTLRRMGVDVPSSCEAGTCGTCLVDLLEGQVEAHDLFLTPTEHAANKLAISCVGLPMPPRLVVDL